MPRVGRPESSLAHILIGEPATTSPGYALLRLAAVLDAGGAELLPVLAAQALLIGLVGTGLGDRLLLIGTHLRRSRRRLRERRADAHQRQHCCTDQALHDALSSARIQIRT